MIFNIVIAFIVIVNVSYLEFSEIKNFISKIHLTCSVVCQILIFISRKFSEYTFARMLNQNYIIFFLFKIISFFIWFFPNDKLIIT